MPRRILIIEDESVLARNLAATLHRLNIESVLASSYAEGVRRICQGGFDLVCADINLGDGNGLDLADQISQSNPSLPVMIMTGQDSVHHRLRAEHAKTPAFLAKPFALSQFRELVASILEENVEPSCTVSAATLGPRVMMYSHDTIGLGHMRRNSTIAAELVARVPGISVLLVAGCPGGDVFTLPPGVDLLKLPTVSKVGRDKWRPASLRISAQEMRNLRSGVIAQAVEQFKPDVFVVDHEPTGVWGELRPAFDYFSRLPEGPKLVLGLRDILDAPEIVLKKWRESGIDQLIPEKYHTVLIYGDQAVFPSAQAYGLNRMPGLQTRYCGYVSASRSAIVPNFAAPSGVRNVLIAGGGGRDAYPMMNAAMSAISRIDAALRPSVTVVAGPLMDDELTGQLISRASELAIRYLPSSNEMATLISQADLFVSMGGYNSMVEAVVSGVQTVVVPRLGPSAEQRMRSELFSQLSLVTTVSMENDLVGDLHAQFVGLQHCRRSSDQVQQKISLDGAQNAAMVIAKLIDGGAAKPVSVGLPALKRGAKAS